MRKNISEKRLMAIKRDLRARAKKMRLGKERAGAYVFGTLRRIQKNPVIFVRTLADMENVRKQVNKGLIIEEVGKKTSNGYRVLLSEPRYGEKQVWGESFDEYAARAFPKIKRNPSENTLFMSLTDRGGKKKTWHIGESAIGGIIAAKVSQNGTAVAIRNATYHGNETISVKLFRWPLDKFSMLVYLNELTTSYYADKIMDWVKGAARG